MRTTQLTLSRFTSFKPLLAFAIAVSACDGAAPTSLAVPEASPTELVAVSPQPQVRVDPPIGLGTPVAAPGALAPVRFVNLYAGGAAMAVAPDPHSTLIVPWLGVSARLDVDSTQPVTVAASGAPSVTTTVPLTPGDVTQVAFLGQASDGAKLVSFAPSPKAGRLVRAVNASPHLGGGSIYLAGATGASSASIGYGKATDWRTLSEKAAIAGAPMRILGHFSKRSVDLTLDHAITEPTTLYLSTNGDEELVVVGVTDSGASFVQGPIAATARVRFGHYAVGVGLVTWRLDGAPIAGAEEAQPFLTGRDYVTVSPRPQATVTAVSGGVVVATLSGPIPKFAELSFQLVGSASAPVILSMLDGQVEHLVPNTTIAQAHLVDARPKGQSALSLQVLALDTLGAGPGWNPFLELVAPSTSTLLTDVPQHNLLLGVDLDSNGSRDHRVAAGYFGAGSQATLTYVVDDAGRPWMAGQWSGGAALVNLAVDRTAWVRLWNVGSPTAVALASNGSTPIHGEWPSSATPSGRATALMPTVDGAHELTVGGSPLPTVLEPLTETTLLVLGDGATLPVTTTHQVEESVARVTFINASAGVVSAALSPGVELAASLGPKGVSGEVAITPADTALSLTVMRADGGVLTFGVPTPYASGTTLMVLNDDVDWPTLHVLLPGSEPMTVHANELSAKVRVLTAFAGTGTATLAIDGETVGTIETKSWGTEKVSVGSSGTVVVPAGAHTLTVTSNTSTLSLPVSLASGTTTELMVFTDGTGIVLPSMGDQPKDKVLVINATTSLKASSLFVSQGGKENLPWLANLAPKSVSVVVFPKSGGLLSVDYDLDGTPDWRQGCGIAPGTRVIILGNGEAQAIAQFYSDYAVIVGKKLPK